LRPEVRVGFRLDQLHIDVDAIASLLHASFQNMTDTQLARDLGQVLRGAVIMRGRSARDDT
jgi:hypothetical protein